MSAALMYCHKKFRKALNTAHERKDIYEAFHQLELEMKQLDQLVQINLYSAATQFIESLIEAPEYSINAVEVFDLRCRTILDSQYNTSYYIVLGLSAIVIACATLAIGGALGIGIGMLSGLWQTPLLYMASLMAYEVPAVSVAALSTTLGFGTGLISAYSFFKEPGVVTAKNHCIDVINANYLAEQVVEVGQEEPARAMNQ
ncbi:hypothetical protein ACD661_16200 [Legionella lytica]|uniref:Uncharacterized protein n=1 Tax=Legionella lytica TaxID=96232 RepID=A0ABW8DE29_9GAMM